ncbi:MAG: M18 family aminopeptidase [Lachnospiraceae bacterium]|nr:M18 family aminopeptidase [Lachnospiraceae bacterium]
MQLTDFLNASPTAFHAVENVRKALEGAGAVPLSEKDAWEIQAGRTYYVIRNGSALTAFHIPESPKGFRVYAAHTDSPSFKLKENPETAEGPYVRLNVEGYGGMLMSTWFDRPLSVAGRVIVKEDGELRQKLVLIDRDLLILPSLAIHMNREANSGYSYNVQKDMLPLLGCAASKGQLLKQAAESAGVREEDVLDYDLFLYVREPARVLGGAGELIAAPHLDDLECVSAGLEGFLSASFGGYISVLAFFDNEEVGSRTRQGAESTFLSDVMRRLKECLGCSEERYQRMIADSFLLSADNGHALHPNHPEKCDPVNRPVLNGGLLLKYAASQRYTTDGYAGAFVKELCRRAGVPFQVFVNRSDLPGGSTLGSHAVIQVPFPTADIGLAILAMHSCYETGGVWDYETLVKTAAAFFDEQ